MRGRANFDCPLGYEDASVCGLAKSCDAAEGCPYNEAKRAATRAGVFVTNLGYIAALWPHQPFTHRPLVILDEGHLAEEGFRSSLAVQFGRKARGILARTFDAPLPTTEDLDDWQTYLRTASLLPFREGDADHETLRDNIQKAEGLVFGPEPPVIVVSEWDADIQPIFGRGAFQKLRDAKTVVMSATLPEPETYARMLGITDWDLVEVPPSFPADRHPFYVLPAAKVTKKMEEPDLAQLVAAVDGWLDAWADRKGIIHTHAYWLQEELLRRTRHRSRLIDHGSRGLAGAVQAFAGAAPGTFLVSPTAHSGVDLPYDQVRGQLILKLPAPNLGDPVVLARKAAIPDSYDLQIAQTLQQAHGRGMRAADDWCDTVMLDDNFRWHFRRNRSLYQDWFAATVVS